MSDLLFLIEKYLDSPTVFLAVEKDKFHEIALADTYNDDGELVGSIDAYDHIVLLSQEAVDHFQAFVTKELEIGAQISTLTSELDFFEALKETGGVFKEGKDYEIHISYYTGFNYFNGLKHRSVIFDENWESDTHILITDENILAMLNNALSTMKSHIATGTYTVYNSGQIEVIEHNDPLKFQKYDLGFAMEFDADGFQRLEDAADGFEDEENED